MSALKIEKKRKKTEKKERKRRKKEKKEVKAFTVREKRRISWGRRTKKDQQKRAKHT